MPVNAISIADMAAWDDGLRHDYVVMDKRSTLTEIVEKARELVANVPIGKEIRPPWYKSSLGDVFGLAKFFIGPVSIMVNVWDPTIDEVVIQMVVCYGNPLPKDWKGWYEKPCES